MSREIRVGAADFEVVVGGHVKRKGLAIWLEGIDHVEDFTLGLGICCACCWAFWVLCLLDLLEIPPVRSAFVVRDDGFDGLIGTDTLQFAFCKEGVLNRSIDAALRDFTGP